MSAPLDDSIGQPMLTENGEVVTGSVIFMVEAVTRLISEPNRPAFDIERIR